MREGNTGYCWARSHLIHDFYSYLETGKQLFCWILRNHDTFPNHAIGDSLLNVDMRLFIPVYRKSSQQTLTNKLFHVS